ncbi:MAG TPA: hypothetical protein VLT45_05910 [Kofleriaceae bacterium]|nr:hypothetical protein [Kofleriaceae bacterium]
MTRRVLIWSVTYGVVFGTRVMRLLDLGDVAGAEPGSTLPAFNEASIARVHEQAVRVANLAAESAEGSGAT